MECLIEISADAEIKLQMYRACLAEFEQLNYNDIYVKQIRDEVAILEKTAHQSN